MEKSHIAGVEEFSILLELSPGDSYRIRWFVGSDPVFSEAVPWSSLGDFIGGIWKKNTISLGVWLFIPPKEWYDGCGVFILARPAGGKTTATETFEAGDYKSS